MPLALPALKALARVALIDFIVVISADIVEVDFVLQDRKHSAINKLAQIRLRYVGAVSAWCFIPTI